MIVYQNVKNMNITSIQECLSLINKNFAENRFDTYQDIITFSKKNKIIGFVGISDNHLNQLCTMKHNRRQGIATQILNFAKQKLDCPIYLYIDKNTEKTERLLRFYTNRNFKIEHENDVEYKMIFDNRKNFIILWYEWIVGIFRNRISVST